SAAIPPVASGTPATPASPQAPSVIPAQVGFDRVVTSRGCSMCRVRFTGADALVATIEGGANNIDTAYGVQVLNASAASASTIYVRDVVGLAAGVVPRANLAVLAVRDSSQRIVYELLVSAARTLS